MKILYTPNLIVPALGPGDRARILEAAGPGAALVEAREPERQRAEIAEADILFGRVPPDIYLWGAGLDVTDPEPLPGGHPFWTHPRVIVTPHTAGGSPRRAGRVIACFCENLERRRDGRPLLALIDKRKGY